MTSAGRLSTRTVPVPGARLYYEVRGGVDARLAAVLNARLAAVLNALAHAMAVDHTVVTTDPRGIAASVVDDPTQDSTPGAARR